MIEEVSSMLERGLYSGQLARYFEIFPQSSFLIFIFEELIEAPGPHLDRLATFLGLDRSWDDPAGLIQERVNASEIPRSARRSRALSASASSSRVTIWTGSSGSREAVAFRRMFGTRKGKTRMSEQARRRLTAYYRDEVAKLEDLLGRDLKIWSTT